MHQTSLYERLGGYDGIAAFTSNLPRAYKRIRNGLFLAASRRRWIEREHQLLIDYLCASAGGLCTTLAVT
jgi:hypothetical protein